MALLYHIHQLIYNMAEAILHSTLLLSFIICWILDIICLFELLLSGGGILAESQCPSNLEPWTLRDISTINKPIIELLPVTYFKAKGLGDTLAKVWVWGAKVSVQCLSPEHHPGGLSWPASAVHGAPAAGGLALESAWRPHPRPRWGFQAQHKKG